MNGKFSVKQATGTFNMLLPDQVIEQTRKEQKGAGGIIGISTSAGPVQRWKSSSHVAAKIFGDLRKSINLGQKGNKHKDIEKKRIKTDEIAVRNCIELIQEWRNPFDKSAELVGLSSQVETPGQVRSTAC